ncbi:MAG TPA: sugar phosphate nucleotidyltransferase [Gemmatimonadales bacterium]|nr:sugar phosphate nucleotidyltransferase [Gemmatimonadales bacterium]
MSGTTRHGLEAVILAGGKGTRLRPYTTTLPKPLMPVGERPILEIILGQLRRAGVGRVTIAVNHMADLIMAFFGDGRKFGLEIAYSMEDQPLGTVAPLRLIESLPERFLVMNGDVLTDLDYADLYRAHERAGAPLTIATYRRDVRIDFGVLEVDPATSRLTGFREKPAYHFDVSMGIYGFCRSVLEIVPADRPFGLDDLVLGMLARGMPVNAYPFDGYWLDIGRPDDYDRANQEADTVLAALTRDN